MFLAKALLRCNFSFLGRLLAEVLDHRPLPDSSSLAIPPPAAPMNPAAGVGVHLGPPLPRGPAALLRQIQRQNLAANVAAHEQPAGIGRSAARCIGDSGVPVRAGDCDSVPVADGDDGLGHALEAAAAGDDSDELVPDPRALRLGHPGKEAPSAFDGGNEATLQRTCSTRGNAGIYSSRSTSWRRVASLPRPSVPTDAPCSGLDSASDSALAAGARVSGGAGGRAAGFRPPRLRCGSSEPSMGDEPPAEGRAASPSRRQEVLRRLFSGSRGGSQGSGRSGSVLAASASFSDTFSSKVGSRRKLFGGTPTLGRHAWSHSEYSSDGQGRRPTLAGSSYQETLAGAVPSDAALRGAGLFQRLLARFGVAYRPASSSAERQGLATRQRGAEPRGTFLVRLLARLSLIPAPAEPPHTAAGAEPASPRELEDEFFCKSYVLRLRAGEF